MIVILTAIYNYLMSLIGDIIEQCIKIIDEESDDED
jgi:hypothetical protein